MEHQNPTPKELLPVLITLGIESHASHIPNASIFCLLDQASPDHSKPTHQMEFRSALLPQSALATLIFLFVYDYSSACSIVAFLAASLCGAGTTADPSLFLALLAPSGLRRFR